MQKLHRLAIAVLFTLSASLSGHAQEARATIGGKVFDPAKAVVYNATVSVVSVDTGVIQTTTTNHSGEWRVQALNPGFYTFSIAAPGFRTADYDAVELQVGDQKAFDVTMQVGARTDTVEVTGASPLLDTNAAVSGTVITTKELEDLPTQSHVPTILAGLTPGVIVGNGVSGSIHLWSNQGASQVQAEGSGSVAGSGAQNSSYPVQYQLDGAYDSNASGNIAFPGCDLRVPRHHQRLRCLHRPTERRNPQHDHQDRNQVVPRKRVRIPPGQLPQRLVLRH
jgi:hypothetical protein